MPMDVATRETHWSRPLSRPRVGLGGRPPVHCFPWGAGSGLSTIPLLRTSAHQALLLDASLVVFAHGRADEEVFQFAQLPMVEAAAPASVHIVYRVPE